MGYYLLLAQSDIPAGRVRWKEMKERRSAHEKKSGSGSPCRSSSSSSTRSSIARWFEQRIDGLPVRMSVRWIDCLARLMWMWQWQLLFVMFGACSAPYLSSLCLLQVCLAPLLCCNCRRHTFRALFDLEIATDRLGMGNIYGDGGISLTWHSRHAHFLAWQDFQASPPPLWPMAYSLFWPFGHNENFDSSLHEVCVCVR